MNQSASLRGLCEILEKRQNNDDEMGTQFSIASSCIRFASIEMGSVAAVRNVALLIETSKAFGRGLLAGVSRYPRRPGRWSTYADERGLGDPIPAWLSSSSFDGIIVRAAQRRTLDHLLTLGVPTVCLGEENPPGVTAVVNDDARCAEMAADHMLKRGFHHFGYVGLRSYVWSDARRDRFVDAIERAGMTCDVLEASAKTSRGTPWHQRRNVLSQWIRSLPKPVGIMACYDASARTILDVCRELDLLVPEQVAIIGVDNDELLCDLCDPSLSSVAPDTYTIGMEAARLLDAMMDDHERSRQSEVVIVPPRGVVTRRSTDTEAISDPLVAAIVGYIRLHACDGLGVAQLLKQFPISRRTLERRFKKLLGRSPLDVIRGERMKRVKTLLHETDLKLDSIASMTGYDYTAYMIAQFREAEGITPGQFRKRIHSERIDDDQS